MTHYFVKVDSRGTLVAAVDDAKHRAAAVFGNTGKTPIDMISQQDWDSWDAGGEKANVGGPSGPTA
ncbi:hypothetical protein GN330_21430 [Nitratireductor sp. CAU 1489]|uniref:Uncharacterized protein n=1 Tax=Nitratireductor arenosus TaxID=2682096 RepID=A0A844QPD6_9HYPH|nr:hypothetical protein [Nitratireductor arenosus]MVA99820.1 hypothetical protein [Nitratireductor arenosus]